jgi:hypothetical protein
MGTQLTVDLQYFEVIYSFLDGRQSPIYVGVVAVGGDQRVVVEQTGHVPVGHDRDGGDHPGAAAAGGT